MSQRGPTIRAAIKRLENITITELNALGVRDLRNIGKLKGVLTSASNELSVREFKQIVNSKETASVQQSA